MNDYDEYDDIDDDEDFDDEPDVSYEEVRKEVAAGVSCVWLYDTILHAADVREAIRNVVNPIDDEICCACFLMNLALTYGAPDYTPVRPGQVLMIDTGNKPPFLEQFFVVDSLTGAISISPEHVYEKGFMIQEGDFDENGEMTLINAGHAYFVGYPDRDSGEFEVIDMKTGELLPACVFMLVQRFDLAEDAKARIYDGNKKMIDSMVADIPDLVISIYAQLQFYKPYTKDMDDSIANMNNASIIVQKQLGALKEDLELLMVSLAVQDNLDSSVQ